MAEQPAMPMLSLTFFVVSVVFLCVYAVYSEALLIFASR